MVIETSRSIAQVAKDLGINAGTLGNWVAARKRAHAGEEPPLTIDQRARLREQERELRELRMEVEFLKKPRTLPRILGERQVRVHRCRVRIFHSDRGSNYTSAQFAQTLKKHKLRQPAGRTGTCYDNAMTESFFAALKNERVHRTQYPTRRHARRDVARYIELRHNSRRRHSGLNYQTPQQVHDEYLNWQLPA